ncbi:hypothetical protein DAH66_17435 [Sphingomonas koreensis]|uniref:Uncharacterized protein n=1 Tax=Sphingomonas koreensis TaxID=93064 RepID=A0A430FZR8_9SPHN|nr:hypothetical protein DAH66_17435 [Sphingomonas koreensis]
MFGEQLDQAHVRRLAHVAIAASRDVEQLTARVADEVKAILADKIGTELASAARLSRDALASHDGQRRWLQSAHKAALNTFHATAEDCRAGKASAFDLFLAQVALAGIARARGLLGIPIEAVETRKMRYVQVFAPADYPDPALRAAIVGAVFNADEASLSLIRTRAGRVPHDDKGQITVLLDAIDSEDQHLRASLTALAGQIIGEDRQRFEIEAREAPDFAALARQLASTLRPYAGGILHQTQ